MRIVSESLEAMCLVTERDRYSLYLETRFLFQQGLEEVTRGRSRVKVHEEAGEPCVSLGCCVVSVSFLSLSGHYYLLIYLLVS